MKTLVRQFLERAEAAGREKWIRSCLALPTGQDSVGAGREHSGGAEQTEWDGDGALLGYVRMMEREDPAERSYRGLETGRRHSRGGRGRLEGRKEVASTE